MGKGELQGSKQRRDSFIGRAVGTCPEGAITIANMKCECLLDSGSQISSVTEEFYNKHLKAMIDMKDTTSWLKISAANHLGLPYVGCIEIDVTIMGVTLKDIVIFVVKDPTDKVNKLRKQRIPGVIGCNIFNRLLGRESDFNCNSEENKKSWNDALTLCNEGAIRQESVCVEELADEQGHIGYVKLKGNDPVLIPANSGKTVWGTTKQFPHEICAVVEHTETSSLSDGLLLCPTLSRIKKGLVPVQIRNYTSEDIWIQRHQRIAEVSFGEELLPDIHITVAETGELQAVIEENTCNLTPTELLKNMDIGPVDLTPGQRRKLEDIITRNIGVFSKDDDDLGYTDLIKHEIQTTNDKAIKQPDRWVPPALKLAVKEQLHKWLKGGIIEESTSSYASQIVVCRKKDSSIRICVDYRELNDKTVKDAFPLPNINQSIEALNGSQWFCSLDMTQ
jgi:hypothetical protein